MRNQQPTVAVSSLTTRKCLKKLKQRLILTRKCLLAKDKIIEGLRLDLDHLVDQLPKIKQYSDRTIN